MAIQIVKGQIKNNEAVKELISVVKNIEEKGKISGTLFIGYPLSASADSIITVDALLVTPEKGLIAINFNDINKDPMDEQDLLYYQLKNTLTKYENLRRRRDLAFSPVVVTFYPISDVPQTSDEYIFCNKDNFGEQIESLPLFDNELYAALGEALQKIASMKPKKKRSNVVNLESYGGKIRTIEKEIANLDEWQKKAAFETPEGPQRIRGLAGSGKTVVLALKAAYLHTQHADWNIAVTFYTRSLFQQFTEMISKFVYEFSGDSPDWEKLQIIHSWGTDREKGIYSEFCMKSGSSPLNYNAAKAKYGRNQAFEGICNELLNIPSANCLPYYDAILIDEAQDMPTSFFKICYRISKEPKRVVFAYDELQNLSDASMPSLTEMFGVDDKGEPLVQLICGEDEARKDIVLPVCYRNTPWALTIAHSLGFGIYKNEGLVQMFNDLELWKDIGYVATNNILDYEKDIELKRNPMSSPKYFNDLMTPEDAIKIGCFENVAEQYKWVSEQIYKNLKEDELDPDDILVIFPDAYYSKSQYMNFREYLAKKNIDSILAGVTAGLDTFRVEGCITCASIFRAKGNEAPMVYIVNADYSAQGTEMIKLRNILFTAITRSRAWVRICGVGEEMKILNSEIQKCRDNNFALKFHLPSELELRRLRLIHRDRTDEEKKKIEYASKAIQDLTKMLNKGELDESLSPEVIAFINAYKSQVGEDDNE